MIDRVIALAAARLIIAGQHRDAFEQGRFAGAVFSHDDGDWLVEVDFEFIAKEWQAIWISLAILDARWIEPQPPQIWRRQIDRAIFSGHSSGPSSSNFGVFNTRMPPGT